MVVRITLLSFHIFFFAYIIEWSKRIGVYIHGYIGSGLDLAWIGLRICWRWLCINIPSFACIFFAGWMKGWIHPMGGGTSFRIRIDGYEVGKVALALRHIDGWMGGRDTMIDEKGRIYNFNSVFRSCASRASGFVIVGLFIAESRVWYPPPKKNKSYCDMQAGDLRLSESHLF